MKALVIILLVILIGGAVFAYFDAEGKSDSQDLTHQPWQWTNLEVLDKNTEVNSPQNYQLKFMEGGVVAVKADCNTGSGSYVVEDDKISFGPMAMTRAFCGEASQDSLFLTSLGLADTYNINNNSLTISLTGDSGDMIFSAAE